MQLECETPQLVATLHVRHEQEFYVRTTLVETDWHAVGFLRLFFPVESDESSRQMKSFSGAYNLRTIEEGGIE